MIESLMRLLRLASERTLSPDALRRMRAPPGDADRVVLSATHLWLRRVPPPLHPKHLCRDHPHLVNRLALCWGDRERVELFIDDLLIDRRGGRRGLSDRVKSELQRLERFHALHPGLRRHVMPVRLRPSVARIDTAEAR
ncbi:MAG: hypothetical protein ABL916_18765 [Burkholderiaceae bacterium]